MRDLAIEEALQEVIKDTLEGKNQPYGECCAQTDNEKNNNNKVYDSSSGHAFIIGTRSKGIIGMVLYSKACRKCDAAEKRREEAEEHKCPKNF